MEMGQYNINLIIRCLGKTATEEEKKELLSWINQNEENERFYFMFKDLFDAGNWDKLKQEAETRRLWKELSFKILEKPAVAIKPKSQWYLGILKYAAVFIIGVMSILVFKHEDKPLSVISKNQVVTGIGERTQLVLPDGTRVWVNSCSSVSYNTDYGNGSRNIYLTGEALFKVSKNSKLPFIVHSDDVKIKALGTTFNVSAYSNDNELSAVLIEGSISFEKMGFKDPTVIKPGEKVALNKSKNEVKIEKVKPELYAAWSTGETRFEHLQLSEIIKRLERTYNIHIVLENERIQEMYFTGAFKNYESLDQILKVISLNTQLTYKTIKDTIYLK